MTAASLLALATASLSCGAQAIRPRLLGVPRFAPLTVGVNTDITWGIPASAVRREVQLMRQAGITWIRATVDLSGVEPTPGRFASAYMRPLDSAIRAARAAGLQVLIEPDRTPYWASADPHKYHNRSGFHWSVYWTYKNPATYASIVAALVRHFQPMGVNAYELWNEPNLRRFWPSGVSASAYTKLLAAAYPAVKRADPNAIVVMGGLSNLNAYNYLREMYHAGAARFYDVANFHIYPAEAPANCTLGPGRRPSQVSFCLLDGLRAEMLANHDHKPAVITEIGWSTCSSSQCVTPQTQAGYITSAYQLLSDRAYSWVQAAFVYTMRDFGGHRAASPWGSGLGLLTFAMAPKPAYAAVSAIAARSHAESDPAARGTFFPAA